MILRGRDNYSPERKEMEGEVEKSDSVTKFPAAKAIFSKLDRATKH